MLFITLSKNGFKIRAHVINDHNNLMVCSARKHKSENAFCIARVEIHNYDDDTADSSSKVIQ